MTFKSTFTAISAAALLALAGPAIGQEQEDAWDADGDGAINESEFGAGLSQLDEFARWDINGDGAIDDDEFRRAGFLRYDRNGDGNIDTEEREDLDRDMEREEED